MRQFEIWQGVWSGVGGREMNPVQTCKRSEIDPVLILDGPLAGLEFLRYATGVPGLLTDRSLQ